MIPASASRDLAVVHPKGSWSHPTDGGAVCRSNNLCIRRDGRPPVLTSRSPAALFRSVMRLLKPFYWTAKEP